MKRAALYLRSSKDKAEVGTDIQRKELEAFARKEGFTVVEVFADMELSGSGDETTRPGFKALLNCINAKPRKLDVVLAVDTSRLARDPMIAMYFARECEKAGIEIRYSKISVDGASAMGEMILSTLRGFDRLHARMSADKGRSGQEANLERGFRAGGRAPMGYKLKSEATGGSRGGVAVTKSKLMLDPATAPKVRAFLQARALGVSRAEAARAAKLNCSVGTLVGLEKNSLTYAGCLTWNRYKKQRRSREDNRQTMIPRPRSEWLIHENQHPGLITRAEAERVLALHEGPQRRANPVLKPEASLLTGLLVDPAGKPFHYDGTTGSYRVGKGRRVKAGWLDAEVLKCIAHDGASADFVLRAVNEAHRMAQSITDDPRVFDAKIAQVRKQLKRLVDALAEGGKLSSVGDRIAVLEQEEKQLSEDRARCAEQAQLKQALAAFGADDLQLLLDFEVTWVELAPENVPGLRTALALLLERVTFDPKSRKLKLIYRLTPTKRKQGSSWRPHGEV